MCCHDPRVPATEHYGKNMCDGLLRRGVEMRLRFFQNQKDFLIFDQIIKQEIEYPDDLLLSGRGQIDFHIFPIRQIQPFLIFRISVTALQHLARCIHKEIDCRPDFFILLKAGGVGFDFFDDPIHTIPKHGLQS